MAGEGEGHRTQIIIALIGLVGVLLTAVISNWDKFFPREDANIAGQQASIPAPKDASEPPVESVERLAAAQKRALDASSNALEDVAAKISAGSDTPDVSGSWRDTDGYEYAVWQKTPYYGYRQLQVGVEVGSGEGQISGSRVRHHFVTNDGNEGDCMGVIEAGGDAITGTCTSGTSKWPYRITRAGKS